MEPSATSRLPERMEQPATLLLRRSLVACASWILLLAKNSTEARLVFAMSSVNADVRGPLRTTARVDDHSASFGHQRRQIIFRCAARGRDHENDWAPHSRRCQHMMALPAERCKIDYGDRSAIPSEPPSLARLRA